MGKKKGGHGGGGGGHDAGGGMRWLLTYADLITLLLVFFIIAYASAMQDQEKMKQVAESLDKAFRPISSRKPFPIEGGGEGTGPRSPAQVSDTQNMQTFIEQFSKNAEVHPATDYLSINFPLNDLIEENGVAIRAEAEPTIARVASFLSITENQIQILASNPGGGAASWAESARQAVSVVRALERNNVPANRLEAVSRGPNVRSTPGKIYRDRGITLLILEDD